MDPFGQSGHEHYASARPATEQENVQATRLLMAAASQLANGIMGAELKREVARERKLVSYGLAGQEGAPPGIGPEPELQHAPGGALLEGIQHPAFDTVEHMFRVLPNDSWTSPDRTPQNPLSFELGAFSVPTSQIFLVTDYEFVTLRQSGVDPFDFVAAAPYRFSGYLGFDITVGGRRASNLFYQLDPAPQQFQRQSFDPPLPTGTDFRAPPQQSQFNRAAANSFASVAGVGSSLLPVRPNVQGPRGQPFTMFGQPNDKVSLSCTIFRRIMAPLAGIQGSVSGYTIHQNTMVALLNRVRPR